MASKPLIPVLHRSGSLVVRTAKWTHLSFVLRGREVEYLDADRFLAVALVPERPGEGQGRVFLELRGTFEGATAYGSHPSRRTIGPLPLADAQAAIADMNRGLGLPKPIHRVTVQELEGDPERYAGQWVDVVVRWRPGFESSACGERMSIWLSATREATRRPGTGPGRSRDAGRYRVVGRFEYAPHLGGMNGFGHMGASRAAITASSMERLPEPGEEKGGETKSADVPSAKGHKAFTLGGRRIDFERHAGSYRVTVDGTSVAMTYEALETTTGNAGTGAPRVVEYHQSADGIDLGPFLDSRARLEPAAGSARRATCRWTRRTAEIHNTVIYEHQRVELEFSEDWNAVKVTWTTDTDVSS